jgi:flagellar motor protein MotB
MLLKGLRANQIRGVRGFADTELRLPTQPLDARNRRVSIVVRTRAVESLDAALRESKVGVAGK